MAAELFVDTSAWYPTAVRSDPDHAAVVRALRDRVRAGTRVVTTNLVVAETHALLLRRVGRDQALAFIAGVGNAPNLVVTSTRDLERTAQLDWLEPFDDQAFSLTDAVSFAVMAERGITEALALDRHFRTAGYRTVPASRAP
ncbi:MAG: type II toxin-antitoxin system VapC family toxin [Gemmatimonadales bacterium]